jgi:hypothetical protein
MGRLLSLARHGLACQAMFSLNRLIDFLTMDGHFLRRLNAKPNLIASNVNDCNDNLVANHDAFIALPG